jgi:hypothetical protein
VELGEVHATVGPIPEWLVLGPSTLVDGYSVQEVLGDWSHLSEWDQPPKYVVDGGLVSRYRAPFDRSETRPDVAQALPGRDIKELKDRHSGKVAIFFNGGSLKNHDLHKVKEAGIPIIGINRTHVGREGYDGPDPDYLCAIDIGWIQDPKVRRHHGLINGSTDKDHVGFRATRSFRMTPFSSDVGRDGFVPFIPGTTGFMALQVAVYMGFTEIWCLGLDLRGKHFDGSHGSLYFAMMKKHFVRMAPKILEHAKVFVCGSPNSLAPFEHRTFEELFA